MQAACIRHLDLPNSSRLFTDYSYHFERVSKFYTHPPLEPDSYRAAARQIRYPDDRRAALVAALKRENGDSPALARLARPGTVAVLTGQQVGLFSGPAYTVFKALTAKRLADRLTEQGIEAVPVFWLATEDHDFAEINHCWVFDSVNQPIPLRLAHQDASETPVGQIPIVEPPIDELRAALAGLPFGDDVTDIVRETYQPGKPLGMAFRDLVARLLHSLGLIFIDPLDPAVREIAAPLLAGAVKAAPDLAAELLRRNHDLGEAGYHAQVHIEPKTSLFFKLEGGRRIALQRKNGVYSSKQRQYSPEELAADPAHLSPNAVLRPVVEDYLLPTIAYVGGPAELAYMAQAEVLYRSLLGRMPVVVPRSGFTLLDHRASVLFSRYEVKLEHFFHGEDGLRERIACALVPPALEQRFRHTAGGTEALLAELRTELGSFDPTLAAALDKSGAKIRFQLEKTHRKIARETLRRNQRAQADAAYLAGLVYPHKHLQERFYTILPFLARHGLDLADRLYEFVRLDCPDHVLMTV